MNVEEDCCVLLCRNAVYKPARLKRGRKVVFDRLTFFPDNAIGRPYGTEFHVVKSQLEVAETSSDPLEAARDDDAAETKDNRAIFDDRSAQKLTHEEICSMKEQGMKGKEILDTVVQNSLSFKERTSFSQEKYVRKKEKRHVPIVRILRPSTRLLCQMYYERGPEKISHIRWDTVAQMLTIANVHANSKVIVVETCRGLLLGATLERLGGQGSLVNVFFGDSHVKVALDNFGHLSDKDRSVLVDFPLHNLATLSASGSDGMGTLWSSAETVTSLREHKGDGEVLPVDTLPTQTDTSCSIDQLLVEGKSILEEENEDNAKGHSADEEEKPKKRMKLEEEDGKEHLAQAAEGKTLDKEEEKQRRRVERFRVYEAAAEILSHRDMDCLLIASRFHPEPILMELIKYLAPSRVFAVYCQFQEPLVQCYKHLWESGKVFNIQLTETWRRNYQVLPGRTHPEVTMDAQSGFLLFGTTLKDIRRRSTN